MAGNPEMDVPMDFHDYMDALANPDAKLSDPDVLDCIHGALVECWNRQCELTRLIELLYSALVGEDTFRVVSEAIYDEGEEWQVDRLRHETEGYDELPRIKFSQMLQKLKQSDRKTELIELMLEMMKR
jgi:hypothetical protein